jgi:hypothetical protein
MATLESLGLTNPSTLTGLALGVVASYAVGGPAKGSLVRAAVFGAIGAAAGRMLLPQRPLSPQEQLALAEQNAKQAKLEAARRRTIAVNKAAVAAKKAAMSPVTAIRRAGANRALTKAEELQARQALNLEAAEAQRDADRAAREARKAADALRAAEELQRKAAAELEAAREAEERGSRETQNAQRAARKAAEDAAEAQRQLAERRTADLIAEGDEDDDDILAQMAADRRQAAIDELVAEGDEAEAEGFHYIGQIYF